MAWTADVNRGKGGRRLPVSRSAYAAFGSPIGQRPTDGGDPLSSGPPGRRLNGRQGGRPMTDPLVEALADPDVQAIIEPVLAAAVDTRIAPLVLQVEGMSQAMA